MDRANQGRNFIFVLLVVAGWLPVGQSGADHPPPAKRTDFQLATFSTDVTCPVGHPLLGGLRQPARQIDDPLFARGLVLLGAGQPIVLCAVDWCEIRNDSYDRWRDALARAAGTTRGRVLLCSIHQHDAPLTDEVAAGLLAEAGLAGVMFDVRFELDCIERTAAELRAALPDARRVTHLGTGRAQVDRIASSRRIVLDDGLVDYGRYSNSGQRALHREAPEGKIDPWLRTISFWEGDNPIAALHTYATHPMSYYGGGGVSADFVGLARRLMQTEHPSVFQIYASGCSGDVTAGKYNDGDPANRPVLARRLYEAMQQAWKNTERYPLEQVESRTTELELPFRSDETHTADVLTDLLHDETASRRDRILAAMGLASRRRVAEGRPIDFSCLDFGRAQLVLFPGESFVGYQLLAQQQRPDSFVASIGYGECWPGYIPTAQGFEDNFQNVWLWVAAGADKPMVDAVERVLGQE